MNTEREALLNTFREIIAEQGWQCRDMTEKLVDAALANKPETSEPVGYINLDKLKKYGMAYAYSFDVVSKSTTQHSAIYTAPPSTAALQKRIEELEAQNKAITGELDFTPDEHHAIADMANVGYSLMEYLKIYMPKFFWSETPAEAISHLCEQVEALKAGDVQAPKEGWISVVDRLPDNGQRVAFVADINKDSVYHYMHGEVFGGVFRLDDGNALFSYPGHSMYASHWMPLPAAPTDKEGK